MNNTVAKILKGVGVVSWAIGLIGGLILGIAEEEAAITLFIWLGCFIEGLLFFALGEIIYQSTLTNYLLAGGKLEITQDTNISRPNSSHSEFWEEW